MKKSAPILLLLFAVLLLSECRYKDNDRLSLSLSKKRLEKTWLLQEAYVDGFNLTEHAPVLLNEELFFMNVEKDSICMGTSTRKVAFQYGFKNNKTVITYSDQNSSFSLKITKLTSKELWMEGDGIGGIAGSSKENTIKVKYIAK